MRRRHYYNTEESVDVNISPLIDMMFLLLIFFIVTTTFVEEVGIEIKKPKATTVESLDKKSIMIALTREGKIIYGGREVGMNGIRGLVSRLTKNEQRPVIILADTKSLSGMLVDVLDECRAAGAKNVSVATETE